MKVELEKLKLNKEIGVELFASITVQNQMMSNTFNFLQSSVQDTIAAMIEISPEATKEFLNKLVDAERCKAIDEHVESIKKQRETYVKEMSERIEVVSE